jgi:hypothetical protein
MKFSFKNIFIQRKALLFSELILYNFATKNLKTIVILEVHIRQS